MLISCEQCRERLSELLEEDSLPLSSLGSVISDTLVADAAVKDIKPGHLADLAAHVATCSSCNYDLMIMRQARAELRSLPILEAPADLRERIRAQIAQPTPAVTMLPGIGANHPAATNGVGTPSSVPSIQQRQEPRLAQPGFFDVLAQFFRKPSNMGWTSALALASISVLLLTRGELPQPDPSQQIEAQPTIVTNGQSEGSALTSGKLNTPSSQNPAKSSKSGNKRAPAKSSSDADTGSSTSALQTEPSSSTSESESSASDLPVPAPPPVLAGPRSHQDGGSSPSRPQRVSAPKQDRQDKAAAARVGAKTGNSTAERATQETASVTIAKPDSTQSQLFARLEVQPRDLMGAPMKAIRAARTPDAESMSPAGAPQPPAGPQGLNNANGATGLTTPATPLNPDQVDTADQSPSNAETRNSRVNGKGGWNNPAPTVSQGTGSGQTTMQSPAANGNTTAGSSVNINSGVSGQQAPAVSGAEGANRTRSGQTGAAKLVQHFGRTGDKRVSRLTITPPTDLVQAQISVALSNGLRYSDSMAEEGSRTVWQGSAKAAQPIKIVLDLTAVAPGQQTIEVALSQVSNDKKTPQKTYKAVRREIIAVNVTR